MAVALIDTNVLVYAHDRGEPAKQAQAVELLSQLQQTGNGRLSTQTVAEFFRATTRGPQPILPVRVAAEQVELFIQSWPVLLVTPAVINIAVQGVRDRKLSYYDAQVWATALLNQVPVIFSEDFADGSHLANVRLVNPFAEEFVLADWV